MAGLIPAASGLGQILAGAADAMFWFFPIILGFNAFKKLGGNPYLGMTLGAALCYPALQGVNLNVLGFNVNATYTSTMLPILVMSFIAVPMEKWLNKVVPDVVKTFVVPAVVLFVCVPVGFCLIGPAANEVGAIINNVIQGAYGFSPIVAGILLGFLWQLLVMVGCHVLVVLPMMMGLMAGEPQPLMAVVAFPSFVQTGAVFAIWLKSKNKKLKTIALPAWISGIFGVTEPAIYGVTLPNGKQFILTCVGAGVIGGLSVLLGVSQFTMGGMGVFALPAMIDPANGSGSIISAVIVAVAAIVIGFIIAFVTYKDKKEAVIENKEEKLVKGREVICSPINGNVLPLSEAKDDAFAQGLLGNVVAIDPADGKVVSPVDGTVMTLFPTKHAIGLVSDNGAEILIHLGMDTVKLDGKYFEAHVKQGDKVKKGDVLVTCDVEAIKAEGYSMITPVIVTNTADYLDVVEMASGTVKAGDDIISCLN